MHSGVLHLGRHALHSCVPLSVGLLLWLELLLNTSFINKKMVVFFFFLTSEFLVG